MHLHGHRPLAGSVPAVAEPLCRIVQRREVVGPASQKSWRSSPGVTSWGLPRVGRGCDQELREGFRVGSRRVQIMTLPTLPGRVYCPRQALDLSAETRLRGTPRDGPEGRERRAAPRVRPRAALGRARLRYLTESTLGASKVIQPYRTPIRSYRTLRSTHARARKISAQSVGTAHALLCRWRAECDEAR